MTRESASDQIKNVVDKWNIEGLIKDEIYSKHILVPGNPKFKELYDDVKSGRINLYPDMEREYIWTKKKSTLLVDSMLRNLIIPEICFWEKIDDQEVTSYDVLDGLQRLQSLVYIVDNVIEFEGFDGQFKIYNGKHFSDLPKNLQDKIMLYKFRTVSVRNHDNDRVAQREYFYRLNKNSNPLSPQELRNCLYACAFTSHLRELAKRLDEYPVSNKNRGKLTEFVTILFALIEMSPETNFRSEGQYIDQYMIEKVDETINNVEKAKEIIKKQRALFDGMLHLVKEVFRDDAFKLPVKLENGAVIYQLVGRNNISKDAFLLMMWGFKPYIGKEKTVIAKASVIGNAFANMLIELRYRHHNKLLLSKKRLLETMDAWEIKLKEIVSNGSGT